MNRALRPSQVRALTIAAAQTRARQRGAQAPSVPVATDAADLLWPPLGYSQWKPAPSRWRRLWNWICGNVNRPTPSMEKP